MAACNVFVTVGTTHFDKLILTVTSKPVLDVLVKKGCRKLVMQVGQGRGLGLTDRKLQGITIECFPLKPSISDDVKSADLVISHGGAGTCLGVLRANKPMIVVVNEDLMDNHQEELADKLAEEGYLIKSTCSSLVNVLENLDLRTLKRFPPGNGKAYAKHIDKLMGF